MSSSTFFYDIGVDPGARNLGIAASNDSVFQACVLDLGGLERASNQDVIDLLNASLVGLFSDPALRCVVVEAGETGPFAAQKDLRITARLFLVQGALQAMAYLWSKEFLLVRPMQWKRAYNGGTWKALSAEENKRWSVSMAAELFGSDYKKKIHHACDAKLLSQYKIRFIDEAHHPRQPEPGGARAGCDETAPTDRGDARARVER